ncbi:MAG: hypothetical protein OEY57_16790 [Nitrospirota bacterium]|nr:hypothetical protein [Nitrospirota bacterium]
MKPKKKGLDPIVKMGLGILLGGFCLIAFGMYLSRPDRSIPPYSVGAQKGTLVALHLPSWTSDPEIESLLKRFREVGKKSRDFAHMKIRPTTPQDPRGRYQTIQIIIFSDPTWTEPDTFQRYVSGQNETALTSVDQDFRQQFEASVRGGYRADESGQAGWIGPWNCSQSTDRTLTMQWIFQDPWAPT